MSDPQSVGFVILSYNEPQQVLRLTETLGKVYGDPPIVCHHNFSQCPLEISGFAHNVRFVQPHLQTGWGSIATVRAGVKALGLLYEAQQPDWFVLLSGSDYPVVPAAQMKADLQRSGAAAFIDMQTLDPMPTTGQRRPTGGSTGQGGFNKPGWNAEAFERYHPTVHMPWIGRPVDRQWPKKPIYHAGLRRLMVRLQPMPRVFGGDPWFTGSARAARALIGSPVAARIERYLARRTIPEEAYYQTILAHAGVPVCHDNFRYTHWPEYRSKSPQWLTAQDLPAIAASGAHFARKFLPDEPALDLIDRRLGL